MYALIMFLLGLAEIVGAIGVLVGLYLLVVLPPVTTTERTHP
jgi:hypothetical protein